MLRLPGFDLAAAEPDPSDPGRQARGMALVFSCEHGGNLIPVEHRSLFAGQSPTLDSHRGLDFGALVMAQELARVFGAPLVASTVSRLLVDLNRSEHHPKLHGASVRQAPAEQRQRILQFHYFPYRQALEQVVLQGIADCQRVVHVSVHSFTPELFGKVRSADVGLLYDPSRHGERAFCRAWKQAFLLQEPALRVRRNYPYEGRNDGLTRYFRRRLSADRYIGVELELNQSLVSGSAASWQPLRTVVTESLRRCLGGEPGPPAAEHPIAPKALPPDRSHT